MTPTKRAGTDLAIVESPAQDTTIERLRGPDDDVAAGHGRERAPGAS